MNKPLKVIFAGTSQFAIPFLEGFFSNANFEVIGVITQPDKPSGRQQTLTPPPIKLIAEKKQIKIWQPAKLKNDEKIFQELKEEEADLLVVVAYGQIIPKNILDLFAKKSFNVHPSLLPKYRGASPIQNAILNGESQTGISIILMDELMDHGPILDQLEINLTGEETNESLHSHLSMLGVPFLLKTIDGYLSAKLKPQPQDDSQTTFCQLISKNDARIDWNKPASEIKQMIHAFYAWPIAWTTFEGKRIKIIPPVQLASAIDALSAGEISLSDDLFAVACGQNSLIINQLQPEGKKSMTAKNLTNGWQNKSNKKFI